MNSIRFMIFRILGCYFNSLQNIRHSETGVQDFFQLLQYFVFLLQLYEDLTAIELKEIALPNDTPPRIVAMQRASNGQAIHYKSMLLSNPITGAITLGAFLVILQQKMKIRKKRLLAGSQPNTVFLQPSDDSTKIQTSIEMKKQSRSLTFQLVLAS